MKHDGELQHLAQDAEKALIGSILLDGTEYLKVSEKIRSVEYFQISLCGEIWRILSDQGEQKQYNPVILAEAIIKNNPKRKYPETLAQITDMLDYAVTSAYSQHYADTVNNEYLAREIIKEAEKMSRDVRKQKGQAGIQTFWNGVEKKVAGLFHEKKDLYDTHSLIEGLDKMDSSGEWGYRWGVPVLDDVVGMFPKNAFVIIGARPSQCKSMMAGQIIDYQLRFGRKVFVQSLEMTREELDRRRLARLSGIPLSRIRKGFNYPMNANDPEFGQAMHRAAAYLFQHEDKRLTVDDRAGLSADDICANIHRAKEKMGGLNVVVIDHFHLLKFPGHNEYSDQTRALVQFKDVGKKLGCAIILLSQFSRSIEHDSAREPRLADLRNCGTLEEIGTNIILLHWEYKRSNNPAHIHAFEIISAKYRDGVTGRMFCVIDPEVYTFGERMTYEEYCSITGRKK